MHNYPNYKEYKILRTQTTKETYKSIEKTSKDHKKRGEGPKKEHKFIIAEQRGVKNKRKPWDINQAKWGYSGR